MSATNPLLTRRSTVAKDLIEPGPNQDEVTQILESGHRVPDHGKIGPWRFIVFQGEARKNFDQLLGSIFKNNNPTAADKLIEFESERFQRAPTVIAVISSPVDHPKVPLWEQQLSAGAACQNMLNAAHLMGYGAQWLTEWYAFDKQVDKHLKLTENEQVAGFMYFGSVAQTPSERNRPNLNERISHWPL